MKIRNLLAMFAIFSLVLVACDEQSTINPSLTPEAPTNLEATSINENTIALRWTASVSDGVTYIIYVYVGDATNQLTMFEDITLTQVTIDGLDEGTIYRFEVYSEDDIAMSDNHVTIHWSPAARFVEDFFDEEIKLFGYQSSFGSGLDLYYAEDGAPAVLSVASKEEWDIAFDDRDGGKIGSASAIDIGSGTPSNTTEISNQVFMANSLDEVFGSQALNFQGNFTESTISFDDSSISQGTKNMIFIARTQTPSQSAPNYAKVMVVRGGDGKFIQGDAQDPYITVQVSYQRSEGVPYAEIQQELARINSTVK